MFTILNRLRGTVGAYSKFIGMLIAYILFTLFNNHYIALSVGVLYVIGESFKWGELVGDLIDGKDDRGNSRLQLFGRGIVWWLCLIPLTYVIPYQNVFIAILLLGLAFPLASHLGYLSTQKFNFKYVTCAWEHQEVWYGLIQDIVIISLILSQF